MSRNFQIAQLLDKDRGSVKINKIDSDQIVTSSLLGTESLRAGTDLYTNLDDLPSDATSGTQAYVSSNNGLYVKYSNGWYRAAIINNSPYWIAQPDGTYSLSIDGTATVITVNAGDSDGNNVTFTATADSDFNLIATVTKDSDNGRIFTIIPIDSENSSNPTTGSGVVTFKASDGISFASQDSTFSITFSTVVADSAATVLLVKALGASDNNDDISYQNGSDIQLDTVGFTNSGSPQATFFSPYRRGGYSTYFDGTGDAIEVPSTGFPAIGTSDFTIEAWVYANSLSSNMAVIDCRPSGTSSGVYITFQWHTTNGLGLYVNGWQITNSSSALTVNTWHHVALCRSSSSTRIFVDGTQVGSTYSDSNSYLYGRNYIGGLYNNTNTWWNGYMRDFRVSIGTARYTSNFTPNTKALTADVNTDVLVCHLPYFKDGSTNDATLTINGNTHTEPFGPYDYNPHITLSQSGYDSDIGSTYFDGSSYVYASALGSEYTFGSGDFTVEAWYWPTTLSSGADAVVTTADTTDQQGIWMGVDNDKMFVLTGAGSWLSAKSTATLVLNQWNHIAAVRNGNTVYGYLNGTQVLSYSETRTLTNTNNAIRIGGRSIASQRSNGYISDVRVIKGTAQYTSAFTPPSSRLQWVTNTVLQMQNVLDPRIYDASSSRKVELVGGTVTNTSTRKFTTSSSIYFPSPSSGTDGIRITDTYGPMSKDQLLTSDFTIEFWVYPTAWFNNDIFMCYDAGSGNTGSFNLYNSSGIKFYADNDTDATWDLVSAASAFSTWTNSWKHFAMTYDASAQTVKIYLDGTQEYSVGSITGWEDGGSLGDYNTLAINQGATDTNKGAFRGYIQDVRVSKSVRYTTTFTTPSAEFEL